jgi:hypothetical protein
MICFLHIFYFSFQHIKIIKKHQQNINFIFFKTIHFKNTPKNKNYYIPNNSLGLLLGSFIVASFFSQFPSCIFLVN